MQSKQRADRMRAAAAVCPFKPSQLALTPPAPSARACYTAAASQHLKGRTNRKHACCTEFQVGATAGQGSKCKQPTAGLQRMWGPQAAAASRPDACQAA